MDIESGVVAEATTPFGRRYTLDNAFSPWLLAALLGLCLYLPTLRGTYIFDDLFFARNDPRLASVSDWGKFWTQAYYPTSQDRLYRPLTSMTYAVEWRLFGDRPWIFHLFNVLVYAADCAAVAVLATQLGGPAIGYFTGLLFAVHPVHVEAVAGLVGRAELLSTGAMLWAMILALGRISPARIAGITMLLVIGLLCKEQAILLPIFIGGLFLLRSSGGISKAAIDPPALRVGLDDNSREVLLAGFREEYLAAIDIQPAPHGAKVNNLRKILFLVLCWTDAAYLICREYSPMKLSWDPGLLDWTMQPLIRAVGINRWLVPFSVLGHYAMLIFVPYKQAIDYGYAVTKFVQPMNDPFLWIGFTAAAAGIIALILAIFKRAWLPVWCLVGIGLSYGMISNFAGLIGTIMGERLMFLPSVFFCLLFGWMIWRMPRRWAMGLLAACILLGAARTTIYANQWTNRLRFYQLQAASNPRSERTWWLLAEELNHDGRYADAMAADEKMREIDANYWMGWYYAAQISLDAGRYDAADKYLNQAWKCEPTGNFEATQLGQKIRKSRGLQPGKIRHNAPSTNF